MNQSARHTTAAVWDGAAFSILDDLSVRPPGANEVAVDIQMAGLCHSDLNPIDGHIDQPLPVVLGHEAVGVIAEVGPGSSRTVGERVVLSVLRSCGTCAACRAGRVTSCRDAVTSTSPFSRDGVVVHQFVRTGAFARRTVVHEQQAIAIGNGIPLPVAAMLGCATVTAFGAVEERARLQPGETVLVSGAGGLGLNAVIAARAAGAARIIVVDRNPAKGHIARTSGATDFIVTSSAADIHEGVIALLPRGVDVAIECVGRPDVLAAAVESLAWGGRCVIVGLPSADTVVDLRVRALFHDKSVLGCRMGSVDPAVALPRLAERIARRDIVLDHLVSKIAALDAIADLVTDLREGRLERGFLDLRLDGDASQ